MNEYSFTILDLQKIMVKMDYSARKDDFIELFNDVCRKNNKDISAISRNNTKYIAHSKLQKAFCNR